MAISASAQDDEGVIPKFWKKITSKNNLTQPSPVTSANKPILAMTREDMLQQIKYEIGENEGILECIKDLKKSKDKNGKELYTYSNGKEAVNIEDLDAHTLEEILDKVHIQASAYPAKLVAEQMEFVRESQRVSAVQQQMPRTPPSQPPSLPAPPPQPTRPPAPPPQPPRR